jgi:hypothetical protein
MRRCVTAAGAMGFRKMRLRGFGVMQRVRGVQRQSRRRTGDNTNQGYSNRPKARQLHPVNVPSTMDFVLYVCPWAAHVVPDLTLTYRPSGNNSQAVAANSGYYDIRSGQPM